MVEAEAPSPAEALGEQHLKEEKKMTTYLLEIKDGSETVAYIDELGEFVCVDQKRMVEALRQTAEDMRHSVDSLATLTHLLKKAAAQ